MTTNQLFTALGFAGIVGGSVLTGPPNVHNMHRWLAKMQAAQYEALKMDWGKPGFCSKWDRDYNPDTGRCADGKRPYRRRWR